MIIFIYGKDSFRSRKKLNELKKKFIKDVDPNGNSLAVLDGENADVNKVNGAISTGSLFSSKRMIVLDNVFANKNKINLEKIYEYFVNRDDTDNIIIFYDNGIYSKKGDGKNPIIVDSKGNEKAMDAKSKKLFNFLLSQKYVQEFKQLSNTETAHFVRDMIIEKGGDISLEATKYLVGLVGGDLWQLNNEIDKLISYKKGLTQMENIKIEVNDIEEFIRGNSDENIFALTDAIGLRDKRKVLELFEQEMESGVIDVYLIFMILKQITILIQVKEAIETGETQRKITNSLKLHPFVVQKSITQAKKYSLNNLITIYHKIVEIDKNIKTGKMEGRLGLSLLLSSL